MEKLRINLEAESTDELESEHNDELIKPIQKWETPRENLESESIDEFHVEVQKQ